MYCVYSKRESGRMKYENLVVSFVMHGDGSGIDGSQIFQNEEKLFFMILLYTRLQNSPAILRDEMARQNRLLITTKPGINITTLRPRTRYRH